MAERGNIARVRPAPGADGAPGSSSRIGRAAAGLAGRLGRLSRSLAAGLEGVAPWMRPDVPAEVAVRLDYRSVAGARSGRGEVAVSLDGGEVRLLRYAGRRVLGWAAVPLPEGVVRSGVVVDAPVLGSALDEAFGQLRLPRRRVVGAVSGLRASSLLLDLPWVRDDELAQTVADEANRALGTTPEDSYLFWQRVAGRRRQRFVYALAVPRAALLTTVEAYDAAGLSPEALDLKPLALARGVNQRDAIVASLEADSLDVVVVVDDLPVLFRSLALPSGLTRRESAEEQLVVEVSRALVAYEEGAPGHLLDAGAAIYLAGGAAASLTLAERLRARTGHPIGRLVAPLQHPSDFPLAKQLVNVGLALKQV